jgi:hypothetical protein
MWTEEEIDNKEAEFFSILRASVVCNIHHVGETV